MTLKGGTCVVKKGCDAMWEGEALRRGGVGTKKGHVFRGREKEVRGVWEGRGGRRVHAGITSGGGACTRRRGLR